MSETAASILEALSQRPDWTAPGIDRSLEIAAEKGCSDVHAAAGQPLWFRRGGMITTDLTRQLRLPDTPAEEMRSVCDWLLERLPRHEISKEPASSVTISSAGQRWRVTYYKALDGEQVTFRRIPDKPPPFEDLGVPETVREFTTAGSGLVLTAGATGSGKTTTLASMVHLILAEREARVLTIEDPVEYLYPSGRSRVSQRQVPTAHLSSAMELAMRSDPDVVLLGEIITPAHFTAAMQLAATGHLVFSTIHANDTTSACQRIVAATGADGASMLSQTLLGIIAQRLLPDARGGFGRVLAAEVLSVAQMGQSARNRIAPDSPAPLSGMPSDLASRHADFSTVLCSLVERGMVEEDVARAAAPDPRQFLDQLQNRGRVFASSGAKRY